MTEVTINLSEICRKMMEEKTKQLEEYQAKGLSLADIVLKEQAEDFKGGFEQYKEYTQQHIKWIKDEIDFLYKTITEGIERAVVNAKANDDSETTDIAIDPFTDERTSFNSGYFWPIPTINGALGVIKTVKESMQTMEIELVNYETQYIKPKK